ncbi:phagocyte signaling impaired [Leptinotarsa decemlineata]|uniref:phagocyte signaling impaired n=1 Tax=Leptinotarsa decemlineata TaxID=7539 RepID=UPI003D30414A
MSRAQSNMHVHQDNSVVERRLRPIYDWIDSGNNKKALQECIKVLKKTPNLHCAKALQALTLHRMGKENESTVILETLTKEKPSDDATLQAMTLCYRETQQLDKICILYEAALKIDPSNEELHTHLFMAYVRISDFKAQQQSAMALYKTKPKNPYYCWAVMSIILQATRGEGSKDPQKKKLLLCLAERMFNKLLTENKIDAEQEVQLYVMILELLEKYQEILEVFDGPLGSKLQCTNLPQNKLKYLKKLNKWSEVNLICKRILINNVDRWDIWKEYVNSVLELMSLNNSFNNGDSLNGCDNEMESVDDTADKAHEFICRILENEVGHDFLLRGAYLARFELCSKLMEKKLSTTELLGETIELFIEYFRKFGHKLCCVSDLRIYLNLLNAVMKSELSTRLIKDVGISSTSVPQTEHQMQRHICALQLSRLCGGHKNLSVDHMKALVTAFTLHYQHGYQTYGKNLLTTDLGPSDLYTLMAAHILYDLAQIEKKADSIIVALMLLENLLKNSPNNFHAKLLAVRLYHSLGGGSCAQEMYCSLDIKHLQLDSLGFIHCARLPTTGLFTLCTNLFDTTLKFFSSNYKDSSDHLTFSYKFGSFIKLDEFMDFRERMNNSLHYNTVAVDRIMLNLVECMSLETLYSLIISPEDNNIECDLLRDNHDLSVYISWDPERIAVNPEDWNETKQLFEQDKCFVKLRTFILFSMANAVEIVKSFDGTRQKHVESLKTVLEEWKIFHDKTDSAKFEPIQQGLLPLPLPSRLHGALEAPYFSVFKSFFEFFLSLISDDLEYTKCCTKSVENELSNLTEFLRESTLRRSNDFLDKRKSMELAVNCVEIVSVTSLICVLCGELVKPVQAKKGKRKSIDSKSKEQINTVADKLKKEMNVFCDILQDWVDSSPVGEVNNKFESLNLNPHDNIVDKILQSYSIANKEMQLILKTKIKLLT